MDVEDQTRDHQRPGEGIGQTNPPERGIGLLWVAGWTLLITAAIPAALVAMTPLAVSIWGLFNLGVRAGLWPAVQLSTLQPLGFVTALALSLATVQWYLLRRYLPQTWRWFVATATGMLLGGIISGAILFRADIQSWQSYWIMAAMLLPLGLGVGVMQWLVLRLYMPNAFWIVLINVLAAASLLLSAGSFESIVELAVILVLPGAITGLGLWRLLMRSLPKTQPDQRREPAREKSRRGSRLGRAGLALAALVPFFFLCSWVYTASQIALAKDGGIYDSPEEAVIARNNRGFGGAEVVRIEDVRARPNRGDPQSPVWFGGATVFMDRVPQGYTWTKYSAGSFYIRVREGWVHVSEGAFPEFIGWVMRLYKMEGVR
jgi:hypothetical protein